MTIQQDQTWYILKKKKKPTKTAILVWNWFHVIDVNILLKVLLIIPGIVLLLCFLMFTNRKPQFPVLNEECDMIVLRWQAMMNGGLTLH